MKSVIYPSCFVIFFTLNSCNYSHKKERQKSDAEINKNELGKKSSNNLDNDIENLEILSCGNIAPLLLHYTEYSGVFISNKDKYEPLVFKVDCGTDEEWEFKRYDSKHSKVELFKPGPTEYFRPYVKVTVTGLLSKDTISYPAWMDLRFNKYPLNYANSAIHHTVYYVKKENNPLEFY